MKRPSKLLFNVSSSLVVLAVITTLMFAFFALTDGEKGDWMGVIRGSIAIAIAFGWHVKERGRYREKEALWLEQRKS